MDREVDGGGGAAISGTFVEVGVFEAEDHDLI